MANGKRWDLVSSHKDKGGTWRSTRVGVVFLGDKGELQIRVNPGISVATPEGCLLTGYEPKPRDDQRGNGRQSQQSGGFDGGGPEDDQDSIPF